MRFVVVIPLSLYLFLCFLAFLIGIYAFAIVLMAGVIYFMFRAPKEMLTLLAIGAAFKFPQASVPIIVVVVGIWYAQLRKLKSGKASCAGKSDEQNPLQLPGP